MRGGCCSSGWLDLGTVGGKHGKDHGWRRWCGAAGVGWLERGLSGNGCEGGVGTASGRRAALWWSGGAGEAWLVLGGTATVRSGRREKGRGDRDATRLAWTSGDQRRHRGVRVWSWALAGDGQSSGAAELGFGVIGEVGWLQGLRGRRRVSEEEGGGCCWRVTVTVVGEKREKREKKIRERRIMMTGV